MNQASLYGGFILLRHQIHRRGLGSHVTPDLWRPVLEAGQARPRQANEFFFPVIKADAEVIRKNDRENRRALYYL